MGLVLFRKKESVMIKELQSYFTALLDKKVSRKKFLKIIFSSLGLLLLSGSRSRAAQASPAQSLGRPKKSIKTDHDLVVASGDDPYLMTVKAVCSWQRCIEMNL